MLLFNRGAAFSFLAGHDGWQRWFFILIALAASPSSCTCCCATGTSGCSAWRWA